MKKEGSEPLRFDTYKQAAVWLMEHQQHGIIHEDHAAGCHGFLILYCNPEFGRQGQWAFSAPDEVVELPDW